MKSRTRSAVGALTATLLASLALLAVAAVPAAAAPRAMITGVSNIYSNEVPAFDQARAAGATQALGPLRWNAIAPATEPALWNPEDPADPNYDWTFYDAWVKHAVQAGITPILQIRGAPSWAQRCVAQSVEAVCDPDPAAFAAFTRAAVRRYSGGFDGLPRVVYWEGLNEPNLSLFFEPQYVGENLASPELYRTLANTFYDAVKSVVPSNIVLIAGLGPIAVKKFTVGPIAFTKALLCMTGPNRKPRPLPGDCGGGVKFDIFDIHPYTTGGPTHKGGPNDVEMGDLGKLQTLIRASDRAGRIKGIYRRTPLWVTEFGWDSKPPDPGGLAMRIEKQWIPEALHLAWLNGVQNFMWYSLADFPPEPNVPFNLSLQTGLYFWAPAVAAQQPKPLMYAFRFPFMAVRKGSGLSYWGRTPSSTGGRVVLEAKVGKGWRRVAVARANSVGIFKGRFTTRYGAKKKGAVRARYRGGTSPAFPMRRVGDFFVAPFG
jgi:hypothetical protein